MQPTILKRICNQKVTTSYQGILAELGVWTIEHHIEYKNILLLHNILNSDDQRVLKIIVEDQLINPWTGCWSEYATNITFPIIPTP